MTHRIPVLFAWFLLAGCASHPTNPEEALLRAHNPKLKVTWADEDVRVPPFDRVMLAPIEFEFRPVPPLAGPSNAPQMRTDYPVPENDRQKLAEDFNEIFREELGDNESFRLTGESGPGVLVVKPALRDIVSRVPPDELPGRSDVYLDSVADATLVVDLVDGASGQTLGRTSDRRTAEPPGAMGGFGGVRSDPVGTGQEMRQLARRWAMSLEKRVEQLYWAAKPK